MKSKPCSGCIACPMEVRGIYAVAFNLLNLYKNASTDPERLAKKLPERIWELQKAVDALQPIIDKHFGDGPKPDPEWPEGAPGMDVLAPAKEHQ